jgi:hypothetical protein
MAYFFVFFAFFAVPLDFCNRLSCLQFSCPQVFPQTGVNYFLKKSLGVPRYLTHPFGSMLDI